MYNSFYSTASPNYESLFEEYDITLGVGSNPPSDSLYNIANMKQLVKLGNAAPNILTDPTLVYTESLLDPAW